jgi:hypothetical protein
MSPGLPPPLNHLPPPPMAFPYTHPNQRGLIPNYTQGPTDGSFILPRPNNSGAYPPPPQQINPHLPPPGGPFQTAYQTATQIPPQGPISPVKQKPKTKPKAKPSKPSSKITKPKPVSKLKSKPKQRPQSSKHLTPSLRAAIITLKVTDPNRSFKEIGDLLAIPQDEDDDDGPLGSGADGEGDDTDDGGEPDTTTRPSVLLPNDASQSSNTNNNSNSNSNNATNLDPLTDPALTNLPPNPLPQVSATQLTLPLQQPKPPTNPQATPALSKRRKTRKPIPRNTVAGIFKRAVERAGTETDLWKLLEFTGRRIGSGRPKKGTGKKDRARAEAEQEVRWRAELEGVAAGVAAGVGVNGVPGMNSENGGGMLVGVDSEGMLGGEDDVLGVGVSMRSIGMGGHGHGGPHANGMVVDGDEDDPGDHGGWEDDDDDDDDEAADADEAD